MILSKINLRNFPSSSYERPTDVNHAGARRKDGLKDWIIKIVKIIHSDQSSNVFGSRGRLVNMLVNRFIITKIRAGKLHFHAPILALVLSLSNLLNSINPNLHCVNFVKKVIWLCGLKKGHFCCCPTSFVKTEGSKRTRIMISSTLDCTVSRQSKSCVCICI